MVKKQMATVELPISDVRLDGETQARCELDEDKVIEYADLMRDGCAFPPIVVFTDGDGCWMADGFHRLEAARLVGRDTIEAITHRGSQRNAFLFAIFANVAHGLPLTRADKRHVVERLLRDDEWSKWSSRAIARHCGVSAGLVDTMRQELSAYNGQIDDTRLVTRGGTTYEQNVAQIGKTRRRYVALNAPPPIQQRLEAGDLALNTAYELTLALETVSDAVRHTCVEAGVSDPALARLLELKKGTETYREIMNSGYIQFGDEHEAVPLSQATARDLQHLLELNHREHVLQAAESKRARQATLVNAAAILTAIGENEVTLQFAHVDLSKLTAGAAVRVAITAEPAVEAGRDGG
jgi:ParB-like chromosome segregation protein Spo0J